MILQAVLSPERRRTLRKLGRDFLVAVALYAGDWLLGHVVELGLPPAQYAIVYPLSLAAWREIRAALGKPATVTGS